MYLAARIRDDFCVMDAAIIHRLPCSNRAEILLRLTNDIKKESPKVSADDCGENKW